MKKFDMKNPKFEKFRSFVFPVVSLVIIVGLSVTVGKSMVNRVFEIRGSIKELTGKNEILTSKKKILNSLDKNELTQGVNSSTLALPKEEPVLPAFVAIRAVALSRGLSINGIRFSGSTDSATNLKVINFTFDTTGSLPSALAFLKDIKGTAPLIRVRKLKFAVNEGSVSGNVTVYSIWEPLPETFGKVDDPIDDLALAEKELLAKMAELKTPTTNAPSTGPRGKKNPFSF